jgi:hypothetical protein
VDPIPVAINDPTTAAINPIPAAINNPVPVDMVNNHNMSSIPVETISNN